jgi:Na+/H+-dicarboxylate symporter
MLFFHRKPKEKKRLSLASKILIGMAAGLLAGLIIKLLPQSHFINTYVVNGIFDVIGKIFIRLLEMLVVPIVFVSLVCGVCNLGNGKKLGRLGVKVISIFIITTIIAVSIGLFLATIFHVGGDVHLQAMTTFQVGTTPTVKQTILNLIPNNPIESMAKGNLLQIIVFSLLFGIAISMSGKAGRSIAEIFENLNNILMKLINIVMKFAPYGVFCLIAQAFAEIGFSLIGDLFLYIMVITLALLIQLFGIYSLLLSLLAKLNPAPFFRKMYSVMLFAFSTSSSNATIPINLETTEKQLGVNKSIAAFTIPLGATINMDGTAIMQGVAAVFIAHVYHIALSSTAYLGIIITTTLASIGTAGVPSVGMITLAMVLQQAGLPIDGIGLIIGVDRIIDMFRTVINISGDTMTACVVAKSEKEFDKETYYLKN